MPARTLASRPALYAALALAGLVLVATAGLVAARFTHIVEQGYGTSDFVAFYSAGKIVSLGDGARLYDTALQESVERGSYPGGFRTYYAFVLPAFSAWIFAPLSLLAYREALLIWMAANAALLAGVLLGLRHFLRDIPPWPRRAFLFTTAASMPAMAALLVGQVDIIVFACFFGAYLLFERNRPAAAGLALAPAVLKPHLLAGVVLLLLLRREWRALASLASLGAPLLALPAVVFGPRTLLENVRLLAQFPGAQKNLSVDAEMMANWRGLVVSITNDNNMWLWLPGLAVIATAALAIALRPWRDARVSFDHAYAIAILFPLIASPHAHTQSLTMAFLAGALALRAAFAHGRAAGGSAAEGRGQENEGPVPAGDPPSSFLPPPPARPDDDAPSRAERAATTACLLTMVTFFAGWYAGVAGLAPIGLFMLAIYALAAWRWPAPAPAARTMALSPTGAPAERAA